MYMTLTARAAADQLPTDNCGGGIVPCSLSTLAIASSNHLQGLFLTAYFATSNSKPLFYPVAVNDC
ncbi:MAG: hypothetical protein IJ933_06660, partial [Bacteroidales bacterium]|nr:hypothetical protein [Bacteroidales bacterium]